MNKKIYFYDFTITMREILASISIIAVMMLFGIVISGNISDHHINKNKEYYQAAKIESQDLFEYSMKTNIGNAFVYGDLKAIDTVSFPEIDGQYMSVEKVKERYTMHTRTVTKTRTVNGKSQTYTTTETYWTWDVIDRWNKHCNKVTFLGVEFDYGQIYTPNENYIDTQRESSNIRYVYYGSSIEYTGTLYTNLNNNTVNNPKFLNGLNIDESVKKMESNGTIWIVMFWIFWIGLTGLLVYGFYYLDNNWLE